MKNDSILEQQFLMTDQGRIDKVKDLYTTFNPDVDLQALKECGYLEALAEMMEPVLNDFDEASPRRIAYWAKRGMVKELHGTDVPMSWDEYRAKTGYEWKEPKEYAAQNRFKKWSSFVPVSAFEKNQTRRYPVVVMLHGGFNPIGLIDGWGVVQQAAKREWIVLVPSIELDDIIDEMLCEAKRLYPVDESRIYAAGFSYGGYMANLLGCKRPDVYAAVAPCGMALSNSFTKEAVGPEPQAPFDGIHRAEEMGVYMPVMNIAGNLDGYRFPLYRYQKPENGVKSYPNNIEEIVEGINVWARVNDAPEISFDDVMALEHRTDAAQEEKMLGIPLQKGCGETVVADGIINYIGNLKSRDGITRVKIMCEMNMPHWPTPEMSRQIFDFFSHFSRDVNTKQSIYHP